MWLLAGGAAIVLMLAAVPAVAAAKAGSADDRFKALYTAEWKWREDQFASGEDNVREIVDHLPKVDPATQEMRLHHWQDAPEAASGHSPAPSCRREPGELRRLQAQLEDHDRGPEFREYEMPANSDTTFWTDLGYTARQDFRNLKDYQHWTLLMRDVPRYFHEQMDEMRAGLQARLHAAAG